MINYYDDWLTNRKKLYEVNDVNAGFLYYVNLLTEKCLGMYTYKNLPESLPAEQIELRLVTTGWCAIFKKPPHGMVTSFGGLSGVDMYYMPTTFVYGNPLLGGGSLTIDKDCVIIYNSISDYYHRSGFSEIIARYARMLSDFDASIDIACINARNQKIVSAGDETTVKTLNEFFNNMYEGKTYAVLTDKIFNTLQTSDIFSPINSMFSELLNTKNEIMKDFLTEIGVRVAEDKKERLITSEVTADEQLLITNVADLTLQRKKGIAKVNEVFKTNIEVNRTEEYKTLTERKEENNDNTNDSNMVDE